MGTKPVRRLGSTLSRRHCQSLKWGSCGIRGRLDEGFHSTAERRKAVRLGVVSRLTRYQRIRTPLAFRDILMGIAQGVHGA